MRFTLVTVLLMALLASIATAAVPGHEGRTGVVTGKSSSYYAYDSNDDYYWDLGDGRIYKTVDDPSQLDQMTLTECFYQVQYRGDFGDDPYLDTGWIINNIHCTGLEPGTWNYLIVHETDPRYTGNPDWVIWGNWEYHVLTESGSGNLVRRFVSPEQHTGQ